MRSIAVMPSMEMRRDMSGEDKFFANGEGPAPQCDVTGIDKVDDCTIRIDFGYGSTRDMESYKFEVCDHVGQVLLKYINNMYTNGKNVRHNVESNLFSNNGNVELP